MQFLLRFGKLALVGLSMSADILILLSGGVDSSVVLAMYRSFSRESVFFDYDQPHKIELDSALNQSASEGVPITTYKLPSIQKANDVVFCGRNATMLSYAFSIAQANNIPKVAIGTNKSDHDRFPDCRPDFLSAMSCVGRAYGVELLHPLSDKTKAEVVVMAKELNVNLENTWTCYTPDNGKQCGKCYSCLGLKDAKS